MVKRHAHDCDKCTPLGNFERYDLYFCEQGGTAVTIIARYGSKGEEYLSGYPSGVPILKVGAAMAEAKGLL